MKFKPSPVKQAALSEHEKEALRAIAGGAIVEPLLCQRLKALGLAAQTRRGWVLTQHGHIRLTFQGAR
jgi:hypothetical protein